MVGSSKINRALSLVFPFTTGKTIGDGSYYRLPSWGCYTLEGKDFKDRVEHNTPQLDKAIEIIMQKIK